MIDARPRDIVDILCWLASLRDKQRTAVHALEFEAVGMPSMEACIAATGQYGLRSAHDPLRSGYLYTFKFAMTFEADYGVAREWNARAQVGNPVRSDEVWQCAAFTRKQQKKAGVPVSQAPVLLRSC